MVQPKQYQLENLSGDCTGSGDNSTVISLTGFEGAVDAQGARISNLADPTSGQDAVPRDWVINRAGSLSAVLDGGNTTDGYDIEISTGDSITSESGTVTIEGSAYVTGKLTVDGLIDPTGLILAPQGSAPDDNAIWVRSATQTALMYTDDAGTNIIEASYDSEPYLAVGSAFAGTGSLRLANNRFVYGKDASNVDAKIIGIDGNSDVSVGDASTSHGVILNTDDSVAINTSGPTTRFTFEGSTGLLEFSNTLLSGASIEYQPVSSVSGNEFSIIGQVSDNATGGALNIVSGNGYEGGGDLNIISGESNGLGYFSGDVNIQSGINHHLNGGTGSINLSTAGGSNGSGAIAISTGSGIAVCGQITITGGTGAASGGAAPGGNGGPILLEAGSGGTSVSGTGGNPGSFILRAGVGGVGGGGTPYSGYVQIDDVLNIPERSGVLWTPGASEFIMYCMGGHPRIRPASSSNDYKVALTLQGTLNFDFGNIGAQSSVTTTYSLFGAAVGDHVVVTAPSLGNGYLASAFVSAANTVTVRVTNYTGFVLSPPLQDYLITVIKAA